MSDMSDIGHLIKSCSATIVVKWLEFTGLLRGPRSHFSDEPVHAMATLSSLVDARRPLPPFR